MNRIVIIVLVGMLSMLTACENVEKQSESSTQNQSKNVLDTYQNFEYEDKSLNVVSSEICINDNGDVVNKVKYEVQQKNEFYTVKMIFTQDMYLNENKEWTTGLDIGSSWETDIDNDNISGIYEVNSISDDKISGYYSNINDVINVINAKNNPYQIYKKCDDNIELRISDNGQDCALQVEGTIEGIYNINSIVNLMNFNSELQWNVQSGDYTYTSDMYQGQKTIYLVMKERTKEIFIVYAYQKKSIGAWYPSVYKLVKVN